MENKLLERVETSLAKIRGRSEFATFLETDGADGDSILLNNSYIYRNQISTTKSGLYLALLIEDEKATGQATVVQVPSFNNDFKLLSRQGPPVHRQSLAAAMKAQVTKLGAVVFILAGWLEDSVVVRTSLNHTSFKEVVLDPTLQSLTELEGESLFVRQVTDPEEIWGALVEHLDEVDESLRNSLSVAFGRLSDEMYAILHLPSLGEAGGESIISAIQRVLAQQRHEYADALSRCGGDAGQDAQAFNEVLRVAYNFSSDALTLIRLLVSICDLKPVVLWCTIGEHFELAEAFRHLPWVRSHQKASLKEYARTIGDARNSAFHDLFPFRKTVEVPLPDSALRAVNLRLFSEHGKKSQNEIRYEDKELVQVLTEFTRARRRDVPPRFWKQNLEVMDATLNLLEGTSETLALLAETRS